MNITEQQFLKLANESKTVKDYLGVPDWTNIVKVTTNSVHRLVGFTDEGEAIINAQFIGKRKYKDRLTTNQMIRLIEGGAFKHLGKRFGMEEYYNSVYSFTPKMGKVAFATTGDLNPDVSPGATTMDAVARRGAVNEAFSTIRAGAGNFSDATSTTDTILLQASSTSNQYAALQRGFYGFDTSSIGGGSTVDSGTISFASTQTFDGFTEAPAFHVAAASPASNTSIANSDYGNISTTSFGNIALASWVADGATRNTITLNASGEANVSKTGVSNFSAQVSFDINNFAPTWSNSALSGFRTTMADNGSNEPILNVTYTPPPISASRRSIIIT